MQQTEQSKAVRPFKAKYAGECPFCRYFEAGDLIMKLDRPMLFERANSKGQYRKVWYAHFKCYKQDVEENAGKRHIKYCPEHGESTDEGNCSICGDWLRYKYAVSLEEESDGTRT